MAWHYQILKWPYSLKQQWNTTKYLLEGPRFKTLTPPNADEDVEQQELLFLLGQGMENVTATLKDSLAVSWGHLGGSVC